MEPVRHVRRPPDQYSLPIVKLINNMNCIYAERERYQEDPGNGPPKGNFIGRVPNLLAWRRECGMGRLSVPCKSKRGHRKSITDEGICKRSYLLLLSLVYNMTVVAEHYRSITINYASSTITHQNNVHD